MSTELLKIAFKPFNYNSTFFFDMAIHPENFLYREPKLIDLDVNLFPNCVEYRTQTLCRVSLKYNSDRKTYTVSINPLKKKFDADSVREFISSCSSDEDIDYISYLYNASSTQYGNKEKEIVTVEDAEKIAKYFTNIANKYIERCDKIIENLKQFKIEEIVNKQEKLEEEVLMAENKLNEYNIKTSKYIDKMIKAMED